MDPVTTIKPPSPGSAKEPGARSFNSPQFPAERPSGSEVTITGVSPSVRFQSVLWDSPIRASSHPSESDALRPVAVCDVGELAEKRLGNAALAAVAQRDRCQDMPVIGIEHAAHRSHPGANRKRFCLVHLCRAISLLHDDESDLRRRPLAGRTADVR